MHFIPNPSNGEFVYLLGLEHVVDYLTKDKKTTPQPQQPFRCAQCKIDFTPVWKMEKEKRSGSSSTESSNIIDLLFQNILTYAVPFFSSKRYSHYL